jgi:hypothetical protein
MQGGRHAGRVRDRRHADPARAGSHGRRPASGGRAEHRAAARVPLLRAPEPRSSSSARASSCSSCSCSRSSANPRPGDPNSPSAASSPGQTTKGGYWFGTTLLGQDVFAQFANGPAARLHRRRARRRDRGDHRDARRLRRRLPRRHRRRVLNMLTNVVLVIPTFALLLVIAAYLKARGIIVEALFIGLTSWPWAARALRAQTFSLTSREFVRPRPAERREQLEDHLQGDRAEHELVPVHDVHPALRRRDPDRRDARLHRPRPVEHDLARDDDAASRCQNAAPAHLWWWFLPPGSRSWRSSARSTS